VCAGEHVPSLVELGWRSWVNQLLPVQGSSELGYVARWAHSECFLHESTKANLASTFQACLPRLHGGNIGQRDLKLEDLLHGHHALGHGNRRG
jgi:hypothetical protein